MAAARPLVTPPVTAVAMTAATPVAMLLATLPAKPRGRATLLATLLVKQSGMRWR